MVGDMLITYNVSLISKGNNYDMTVTQVWGIITIFVLSEVHSRTGAWWEILCGVF